MRRKSKSPPRSTDSVVPREILERAQESLVLDNLPVHTPRCVVCGSECAPNSSEGLCWVCRRLKISAWRDPDMQASANE
jgi:hypothetical protein